MEINRKEIEIRKKKGTAILCSFFLLQVVLTRRVTIQSADGSICTSVLGSQFSFGLGVHFVCMEKLFLYFATFCHILVYCNTESVKNSL